MGRFASSNRKLLEQNLQEFFNEIDRNIKDKRIRVYHRGKIESDICIVLFHEKEKVKAEGSRMGLHLVAALKEFGLVNHNVWTEIGYLNSDQQI